MYHVFSYAHVLQLIKLFSCLSTSIFIKQSVLSLIQVFLYEQQSHLLFFVSSLSLTLSPRPGFPLFSSSVSLRTFLGKCIPEPVFPLERHSSGRSGTPQNQCSSELMNSFYRGSLICKYSRDLGETAAESQLPDENRTCNAG